MAKTDVTPTVKQKMTDDEIFKLIIKHEGTRYTNHPLDLGGPTKYGITILAWRSFSGEQTTAETIKNLTLEDARAYYHAMHIRPLDMLEDPLRIFVIDLSILRGMRTAIKMVQAIVGVTVDGWIGRETLKGIAAFDEITLTHIMIGARLQHIEERVKDSPSQVKWRNGWRNRTLGFLKLE